MINIKVNMIIDNTIFKHIKKKDAVATIGSDGLVGSMIISTGNGKEPPVEPGDEIRS
jgi:phospholipid/cholesterol/gamma-HCH transport system substrate-binding protein